MINRRRIKRDRNTVEIKSKLRSETKYFSANALPRLVVLPVLAVVAEHAARARAEANQQADHRPQRDPVRVPVLGRCAARVVVHVVLRDGEQDHGYDPHDDADEGCEGGEEGHEHGSGAVVARAAQAKEDGDAREAGSDGVEDEHEGEAVDDARVELAVREAEAVGGEGVADVRFGACIAEDTKVGGRAVFSHVKEGNFFPHGRGYADLVGWLGLRSDVGWGGLTMMSRMHATVQKRRPGRAAPAAIFAAKGGQINEN